MYSCKYHLQKLQDLVNLHKTSMHQAYGQCTLSIAMIRGIRKNEKAKKNMKVTFLLLLYSFHFLCILIMVRWKNLKGGICHKEGVCPLWETINHLFALCLLFMQQCTP